MNSDQLNAFCADADEDTTITVRGLERTGKVIPYIGWVWRDFDWDDYKWYPLGHCGDFVGFMVSNKWDYPSIRPTPDQAKAIRALVEAAAAPPTSEAFQAVFDYIQALQVTDEQRAQAQASNDETAALQRKALGFALRDKLGVS